MQVPWMPSSLYLDFWFNGKADENFLVETGKAATWFDISGHGRHLTQPTLSYRPAKVAGGIYQDSATAYRYMSMTGVNVRSLAIVHTWAGTAGNYRHISDDWHGGAAPNLFHGSYTLSQIRSGLARQNGTTISPLSLTRQTQKTILILQPTAEVAFYNTGAGAGFANRCFYGSHFEIIGSREVWDLATIQLIEGYLAWGHGTVALLPSDHPYKLAAPTTEATRSLSGIVTVLGSPAQRHINIYANNGTTFVGATLSDPVTGEWSFNELPDDDIQYTVTILGNSGEYSRIFNAVVAG